MAETDADFTLLRVPLAASVPVADLTDLLVGLTAVYEAVATLELTPPLGWAGPDRRKVKYSDELLVMQMIIGTPNDLKILGRSRSILGGLGIVAAILALPKVVAETQSTLAEAEKTSVETTAAELELLAKARRMHSEGLISRDEQDHVLRSLEIGKASLRRATGIVRESPSTMGVADHLEATRRLRILQRARALGVADPDADMWIGLLSGDLDVMRMALQSGADPNKPYEGVLASLLPKVQSDPGFRELVADYLSYVKSKEP